VITFHLRKKVWMVSSPGGAGFYPHLQLLKAVGSWLGFSLKSHTYVYISGNLSVAQMHCADIKHKIEWCMLSHDLSLGGLRNDAEIIQKNSWSLEPLKNKGVDFLHFSILEHFSLLVRWLGFEWNVVDHLKRWMDRFSCGKNHTCDQSPNFIVCMGHSCFLLCGENGKSFKIWQY
jgi:hypothetical protein